MAEVQDINRIPSRAEAFDDEFLRLIIGALKRHRWGINRNAPHRRMPT